MKPESPRIRLQLIVSILVLTLIYGEPAPAAPVKKNHVEVELVSAVKSIQPGQPLLVALRMKMDDNWHTYWKNPGADVGLPTRIEWRLPAGFEASPIKWPCPEKFVDKLIADQPPLVSYGYKGEVFLLTTISPPQDISAGEAVLSASVRWLACEQMCIPGAADLSLTLPVHRDAPKPNPPWANRIARAKNRLPLTDHDWQVTATLDGESIILTISPTPDYINNTLKLEFYPDQKGVIDDSAVQLFELTGAGARLQLRRPEEGNEPARLRGLLVANRGLDESEEQTAFAIDVPAASRMPAARRIDAPGTMATATPINLNVVIACIFAFLGGLLLNLMPCVLPVLSLKVLGLVRKAGEKRSEAVIHGIIFTFGVLVTFWVLAGVLIAFRAGGRSFGWGFQLQSPVFLVVLMSFLFLFALSLFGVFDIGMSLMGIGQQASGRSGYAGSFFTGVVAVIVATPCTAPFMGTAMGFALTQPVWSSITIFTSLGFGLALPYLILAIFPAMLKFIPRPGLWMETFKQLMGFLLMATVIWLLWVLGGIAGNDALAAVLTGLLVTGFGGWIIGRFGAPSRSARSRMIAYVMAILLIAGGIGFAIEFIRQSPDRNADHGRRDGGDWEPYSPVRVEELRGAGVPVFIDFTADWCLTCKVNEEVAFNQEVMNRFRELGVTLMVADFTRHDDTISNALSAFGRSGVPLYVLYGRDIDDPPMILPQLLTPAIVLDALKNLE